MTATRERPVVPKATFRSYYGRPVLKEPVWKTPDIPGYLFVGGVAAGSSLLAAGAQATGRRRLARRSKVAAVASAALSGAALVHDLGRPERFANMLRVFKVTSPMSVGSWLLAGFSSAATAAAVSDLTGRAPRAGAAATTSAATLGLGVATYTAALLSNTAVPAWHEGYRELPFTFAGSAATSAAGLALVTTPLAEAAPARRLALAGAAVELVASDRMKRRLGALAEPYESGKAGRILKTGEVLTAVGSVGVVLGRRSRAVSAIAGASLLAASACTRFGIFEAGRASAKDPRYTVVPQRERLRI